jgi:hypothetical protein
MTMQYNGVCGSCGVKVVPGERAWYDRDFKKITCGGCWSEATPLVRTCENPVGGSSTLNWSENGHARNRRKGAAGEYLMDTFLYRELQNEVIILNDRRLPNGRGNIDHIVVASSGVWIIDTKNWSGRIECKTTGGILSGNEQLLVGGVDHTEAVNDIYAQVIPIASLVDDRSVPVHAAIVFVNGNWGPKILRILTNKPYRNLGVWITWPKALSAKINTQGPLAPETIDRIGVQLSQQLTPM